jgi:hypothetical protein
MSEAAPTYATCGKDLRESSERRKSGGSWYCSAYCALHDEVAESHKRTTELRSAPPRRLRRTLTFTLVFVLAPRAKQQDHALGRGGPASTSPLRPKRDKGRSRSVATELGATGTDEPGERWPGALMPTSA